MANRALTSDSKSANREPATAATGTAQAEAIPNLNPEEIAARSYELWQERGNPIGSPEIDWFRAEEELRHRYSGIQSSARA